MKQYRSAIQLDQYWIADFESSLVLHHKISGQVLLLAQNAFVLLSAFPNFSSDLTGLTFHDAACGLSDVDDLTRAFDQLCKAGYLVES